MKSFRRHMEAPVVNAPGYIVKPRMSVRDELSKRRLKLLRIAVVAAFFYGEFERYQRIEERTAKLRQHAQAFSPARPPGRLIARGFQQLVVAAQHGESIFAQRRQVP